MIPSSSSSFNFLISSARCRSERSYDPSFEARSSSRNPEAIIPVGSAIIPIPTIIGVTQKSLQKFYSAYFGL